MPRVPVPAPAPPAGRELALQVARLAQDRRLEEILVLDLTAHNGVTDYFVIATGRSERLLHRAAEEMRTHFKHAGVPSYSLEGMESAWWVLLDLGDVVVHLFSPEGRRYYDLEHLWGGSPRVSWESA